jgi:uncharacterized membrane protein
VRLLDIFIGALIVFPWLTESIRFDTAGGGTIEVADWAVPLLVVGVVAEAPRLWWRASRRAKIASGAGLVGALAGFSLLFELLPDMASALLWSLTHGPGAVLTVALIAAAAQRWSGEPWERSFFLRLAAGIGRAWHAALERSPRLMLWATAAAVGAFYFGVTLVRHWSFHAQGTHGYDLGIFTNVMWNLTHGNGYVSSVKEGINLFTDHQSPTYWLLAPLFWLIPRPETLLGAQAFGLAAGAPALYYLGAARFGRSHWAPAALPWLYWAYLPLRNANAFDFHPEVFMLPLFLWAFVGLHSEGRWPKALGVAALIAALGAKESAPVVAVGIGIAWAFTGARWRGTALALAGVAIFYLDVKLVPRLLGAADYAYMGLYERFGGGLGDLVLAPFTQPGYFFSQLINAERLKFLFWTLAPIGFLPLFHWRAALAALPPYLMLFLSEGDQRVRIYFHYGIEPASALFWALPFGLAAFAGRFGWRRTGIWLLPWAIAGYGTGELARMGNFEHTAQSRWLGGEVIPCLDPQLPMAATDTLIPHLATRAWISYPDLLEQKPSGAPVACVVTTLEPGTNWPLGQPGVARVLAELPQRGYREAWRCGDYSVHELESVRCLRCVPACR